METMALGSPVNSTNAGQQPSGGAQYLPGFLMGDISIQVDLQSFKVMAFFHLQILFCRVVGVLFKQVP